MKSVFIIILNVTLFLIACSKGTSGLQDDGSGGGVHGPVPNDTIAPVITVTNPMLNQTIVSGTAITITGTVTDENGLYQGYVLVTADASGVEIKKQSYEIHGFKSYAFSVPFTPPTVTVTTDCTVTVLFEDHGNNKTTKSVKIKVTP
ncbi:MAG: hypothetical protein RIR12_800 [Bacteroidota bacterium]|jgi:hypothetical protein